MAAMRVVVGFLQGMRSLAWPWQLWLGVLVLLNGIVPLAYLERPEAWVTLLVFLTGANALLVIHWFLGFVRLMGIGHFGWFALIPWLGVRLDSVEDGSLFAVWIVAVILVNAISLVIDVSDVVRYARGECVPTITYGSSLVTGADG